MKKHTKHKISLNSMMNSLFRCALNRDGTTNPTLKANIDEAVNILVGDGLIYQETKSHNTETVKTWMAVHFPKVVYKGAFLKYFTFNPKPYCESNCIYTSEDKTVTVHVLQSFRKDGEKVFMKQKGFIIQVKQRTFLVEF